MRSASTLATSRSAMRRRRRPGSAQTNSSAPRADRADDPAVDRDPRLGDALHQRDHCDALHGVEVRLDVQRQQLDRCAQPRRPRSSTPARPRRAAPRRARASSSPGCACACRGSGGCRRAASPCRRSGPSFGRTAPGCDRCSPAPPARAPCPSGRRPSPQTTRAPSRMMLAATPIATTGSSHSQPVSWTRHHADDDAGRRPDVGEQVARVGLERDRSMLRATRAASSGRAAPLRRELDDGERQADADALERLQVHEALHAAQTMAIAAAAIIRPSKRAREVLGLGVAERMVVVGRPRRDVTIASANSADARLTSDSSASESRLDRAGDPPGRGLHDDVAASARSRRTGGAAP